METLTYKQAAELLNCNYAAIRSAASDKRLTPIHTKQGPRLFTKQVELFIGKRAISANYLNIEEQKIWEEYKENASHHHQIEDREIRDKTEEAKLYKRELSKKIDTLKNASRFADKALELISSMLTAMEVNLPGKLKEEYP